MGDLGKELSSSLQDFYTVDKMKTKIIEILRDKVSNGYSYIVIKFRNNMLDAFFFQELVNELRAEQLSVKWETLYCTEVVGNNDINNYYLTFTIEGQYSIQTEVYI